jgi:hypothetical protein
LLSFLGRRLAAYREAASDALHCRRLGVGLHQIVAVKLAGATQAGLRPDVLLLGGSI